MAPAKHLPMLRSGYSLATLWRGSFLQARSPKIRLHIQLIRWAKSSSVFRTRDLWAGVWSLTAWSSVQRPSRLLNSRAFPARSQITMIGCEEGWTYIAEWTGVPLSHILELVGTLPHARYVVYRSIEPTMG